MALQRYGGRVAVRVNGTVIESTGEFTFQAGQPVRTVVLGADGPVGYLEEPGTAMIAGELYFLALDDAEAIINGEEQTVQLDLAAGKQFVLEGAWFSGNGEFDVTKGTLKAEWTGRKGRIVS